MTKRRPTNVGAAIRQRLLQLARAQREDFQLVLIRYSLERFLYRLSRSPYRNALVLKGALLFQVWTQESHRPTRDVDFLGHGEPSVSRLLAMVGEICQIEVPDDGLAFDRDSIVVEQMKEEEKYPGLRVRLNCYLETARIPVQIDIGFGDAVTPQPVEIDYPVILDQNLPNLLAYPRETVIAEKYEAIILLGMTNSRMKDFFDLWRLSHQFAFEGKLLSNAIRATFDRRGTPLPTQVPLAFTEEFALDDQKRRQWKAFLSRSNLEIGSVTFAEVLSKLAGFLLPPSIAAAKATDWPSRWPPGGGWGEDA